MGKYKLSFKKSVAKDLRKIPNNDVKRILNAIESLAVDPYALGCLKLSSDEKYHFRVGAYRIVYEIFEYKVVVNVIKISHRLAVYRK